MLIYFWRCLNSLFLLLASLSFFYFALSWSKLKEQKYPGRLVLGCFVSCSNFWIIRLFQKILCIQKNGCWIGIFFMENIEPQQQLICPETQNKSLENWEWNLPDFLLHWIFKTKLCSFQVICNDIKPNSDSIIFSSALKNIACPNNLLKYLNFFSICYKNTQQIINFIQFLAWIGWGVTRCSSLKVLKVLPYLCVPNKNCYRSKKEFGLSLAAFQAATYDFRHKFSKFHLKIS